MPKRVIDFDAMWGSDKLASCAEWAQAEYAWLYGLADASGCFELTNLRVIWGRVAAIRHNLTLERLEQIFGEFHDKGLLFVWEENGKRYGHWTGSDVPGRLPPPSWRVRLERLAPPVPKQQLAEFMSKFARGRAASPGGGFLSDIPQGSLKVSLNEGLEPAQAQDWNWNREEKGERKPYNLRGQESVAAPSRPQSQPQQTNFSNRNANSETKPHEACSSPAQPTAQKSADKASIVARELRVGQGPGQGPSCGPIRVKPEALERIRARDGARSP